MQFDTLTASRISILWSINEWGRLREVILGSPEGARLPSMDDVSQRNFDRLSPADLSQVQPGAMPEHVIEETREDLADLALTLRRLGVVVHQAEGLSHSAPVQAPEWQAEPENAINIRDITLIHGDLVVDAPSPTRGRAFETYAVRDLLSDAGDRSHWMVAPPRPCLRDHTYDLSRERGINDTEPLFDAANCVRLGTDIIIDLNNTANSKGASWLQQTLDRHHGTGKVRVHPVSLSPDHIDVIIVPLCEGTALFNPQYVDPSRLPSCLDHWTLIPAPDMVPQPYFTGAPKASNWIGLNVLVIDGEERTVLVEERQRPLLRLLDQRGFRPIPTRWRHGRSWGGGFHCVSLDVCRTGEL
jgi:glycine amidinotransferase